MNEAPPYEATPAYLSEPAPAADLDQEALEQDHQDPQPAAATQKPRKPRTPKASKPAPEPNPFTVDMDLPSWVRPTLQARAQKRVDAGDVERDSDRTFAVQGNAKAGDQHDSYTVTRGVERWHCSCQGHQGGQYRGVCSHIVAAMIVDRRPVWNRLLPERSTGNCQDPGQCFFAGVERFCGCQDEKPAAAAPEPAPEPYLEAPFHDPFHGFGTYKLVQWDNQINMIEKRERESSEREEREAQESMANNPFQTAPAGPDDHPCESAAVITEADLESAAADPPYESAECELAAGDWPWLADHGWIADGRPRLAISEDVYRREVLGEWIGSQLSDPVNPPAAEEIFPAPAPNLKTSIPAPASSPALDPRRDPIPALKLPPWAPSLRSHQEHALRQIYLAFASGKRNVILEGPTGAGKTLVGHLAAQMIGARSLYVCTTKSLQDQYLKDFPAAKMIKGRRNYPTQQKPFPDWTCEDCDYKKDNGCSHCDSPGENPASCKAVCPYQKAKTAAERADEAVLNTAYFIGAINSMGSRYDNAPGYLGHSEDLPSSRGFRHRGLAIFDEADELESALMGAVELVISKRALAELGVEAPDPEYSRWPDRLKWIGLDLCPAIEQKIKEAAAADDERAVKRYARLFEQAQAVLADAGELQSGNEFKETWVYDIDKQTGAAVFKPVRVAKYGQQLLFQHSQFNLIMSATIVAPELFAADLGLDLSPGGDTVFIPMPSTFPKERRPVFLHPVANVTRAEMHTARPKLAAKIAEVCKANPGVRILVHTVSYELTEDLRKLLADDPELAPRLNTYRDGGGREAAIERHLARPDSVTLAPSLDRGINWKGDQCRVIVVSKCPWPNKGDKQIKRRIYQPTPREGELWFRCQALRTVIQMCGRGMRSESDWCRTYILDQQFANLYQKSRQLLPEWWREAVISSNRDPLVEIGL